MQFAICNPQFAIQNPKFIRMAAMSHLNVREHFVDQLKAAKPFLPYCGE
jgi:hypothetical protein